MRLPIISYFCFRLINCDIYEKHNFHIYVVKKEYVRCKIQLFGVGIVEIVTFPSLNLSC